MADTELLPSRIVKSVERFLQSPDHSLFPDVFWRLDKDVTVKNIRLKEGSPNVDWGPFEVSICSNSYKKFKTHFEGCWPVWLRFHILLKASSNKSYFCLLLLTVMFFFGCYQPSTSNGFLTYVLHFLEDIIVEKISDLYILATMTSGFLCSETWSLTV